ncbi:MAG: hypothetical protein AAF211_06305 [Myxococcota bacterium]
MRHLAPAVLTLVMFSGCHARFKRNVGSVDDVQLQVLALNGPSAALGRAYFVGDPTPDSDGEQAANVIGAVAAGVFNVVQGVKEAEIRNKIAQIDVQRSNDAMLNGVAKTLGSGPPFEARGRGDSDNLLQLELVEWGLQVPAVGVPGSFDYVVRARIYNGDGRRIYKSRLRCQIEAGDPSPVSQALLLVNNAKQVKRMSIDELQASFDTLAEFCGGVFVSRMRRHAG